MNSTKDKKTIVEGFLTGFALAIICLSLIGGGVFFNNYQEKFYPGIKIDGMAVGGKTRDEAMSSLIALPVEKPKFEIELRVDNIAVVIPPENANIEKNYNIALSQAFEVGRTGFPLTRIWQVFKLQFQPENITSPYALNPEATQEHLDILASHVDIEGKEPSAMLKTSGQLSNLEIFPGKAGRSVDKRSGLSLAQDKVAKTLEPGNNQPEKISVEIPVASTAAVLDEDQLAQAETRASHLVGQELEFTADNLNFALEDQDLIGLLTLPEGINQAKVENIIKEWAKDINRAPTNAEFEYDKDSLQVTKFVPQQNGLKLDLDKATRDAIRHIEDFEGHLSRLAKDEDKGDEQKNKDELALSPLLLPVEVTQPEITLADTNDLGINELIGHGDSEYDHSIPNRIHNVSITADKINLTLVPPDKEFSFNKTLGEVSARTGYRTAYVIKDGRTALGDGGGVCQVSTTLFRSVLNAGLPVTRRLQHSYRVSYYELNAKPGLDATVYSGNVDFRFVNDTGHYILVASHADSDDLYMEVNLYGTSDGRSSEITSHEVWDPRPAPPAQYIETTDIPSGTKKQVDWAVGGVKARVVNVVKDKNGDVIREEEYYSNYVPWSAKYLVGI